MQKVRMSPVFSTPEQEALFAKCARASKTTEIRLTWQNEENEQYKNVMLPVFSTPEQEELFAKAANEAMSTESILHW